MRSGQVQERSWPASMWSTKDMAGGSRELGKVGLGSPPIPVEAPFRKPSRFALTLASEISGDLKG